MKWAGLTGNRYFQRFRQNGKWYLQLFLGICLSNIFVFGHLGDPSSLQGRIIYSFEGNPRSSLRQRSYGMIHEHDATANDIVNTFMNQKDPVGIYFACASMLCPIFHSQTNKRSFVEETVLLRVIHPIWNCLHPSDQPNHADLLQFGQEVPGCYDEGLDIVAAGVSTESQAAVQNANLAFKKFEASVRSVKTELEWPLAERKARDVFEQHRVLISAFSSMRTCLSRECKWRKFLQGDSDFQHRSGKYAGESQNGGRDHADKRRR